MIARYVGCALVAFCVLQLVAAAGPFYLTGTIRDFLKTGNSDFGRSDNNVDVGGTSWVKVNTDVLGKPLATGTTTTSVSNFASWWDDGDLSLVAPYSIQLTETALNSGFFKFDSGAGFYPINGQLGGNQGDANNLYWTYELHTMFRYIGDGSDQMVFQSAGDLYVYLNGRLCGTTLTGIHAVNSLTLNPASCASAAGMVSAPATNYKVDIFYAHRSSQTIPQLSITVPLPRTCNANTTAVGDKTMAPYTATNTIVSGISEITSPTAIRLSRYDQYNFNGAVYNSIKKRISNGFVSTFKFQVTNPSTIQAEGFAFVLQSTSSSNRGSGGANLGYNIVGSLAIEFDMANSGTGDTPNANHVELHCANDNTRTNSATNYNIASTPTLDMNTAPVINMKDGSVHAVRILYAPCLPVCQTPAQAPCGTCTQPAGVFAVYVDEIMKLRVLVDDGVMKTMQSAGAGLAYVGFTVGTSSIASNIDITEWKFYTPPVSSLLSIPVETPGATGSCTAGCTTTASNALQATSPFYIRAADACGLPLTLGGENAQISWVDNPGTGIASISDAGNGQYSILYAQQKSGSSRLAVTLNSQNVALSPLPISVAPAIVSAPQSSWPGSIPTLTAGQPVPLTVTAYDQFGNPVTTAGAPLTVQITSGSTLVTMPNPTLVSNQYTFQVSFTLAGSAQLYVRANNFELPGSPYTVIVNPAVANGGVMDGLGGQTVAGAWSSLLKLYPTDNYGNAVQTSTGYTLVFNTKLATDSSVTGQTILTFVPKAGQTNAYWNLTKTATKAGFYLLTVTINGNPASGLTGYQDEVIPAAVSGVTSVSSLVQTGTIFYAGINNNPAFYVQAYDVYGNLRGTPNPPGSAFTVTITPPSGAGAAVTADCSTGTVMNVGGIVQFACTNDGTIGGKYNVAFQCQKASTSTYSITVFLAGVQISQPIRTFTCQPGDADASMSAVTATPNGNAGLQASFVVTVRDRFNNTRSSGQNLPDTSAIIVVISSSKTGVLSGLPAVTSLGGGLYQQVYNPTVATTYSLTVSLNPGPVQIGTPRADALQVILPGVTAALATQFSGAGYQPGRLSGTGATYHLVAFDSLNNPRLANVDTFRAYIYPNDGSAALTYDSVPTSGAPGEYDITYTVPTYTASVTAFNLVTRLTTAGLPGVFAANVSLSVSSGTEAFAQINAQDGVSFPTGLFTHVIGQTAVSSFQVTRTDRNRVLTPTISTLYEIAITPRTGGPNGPGDNKCVKPPFQQLQPGRYLFQYYCKTAGDYSMAVLGGGTAVNTTLGVSPFNLTVLPGAPQDVRVTGIPTSRFIAAGAVTPLSIQLLDAFGNNVPNNAGYTLQMQFFNAGGQNLGTTPISTTTDITCATPAAVPGTGTYTVSLTSRLSGTHSVHFFLNGVELPGRLTDEGTQTPPVEQYTVQAASPDPTKTIVNFGQTPAAIAGTPTDVYVQVKDTYGNTIVDGTLAFTVTVQDNPSLVYSATLEGAYYKLRMTPTVIGAMDSLTFPTFVIATPTYAGLVLWSGVIKISAAGLAASTSSVAGLPTAPLPAPIGSLGQAQAGQTLTFRLNARDIYGNGLSNINPNLAFICKVSAILVENPTQTFGPVQLVPPTTVPRATVTSTTQGVFTWTYMPTKTGAYTFSFYSQTSSGGNQSLPVQIAPLTVPVVTVVAARATAMSPPLLLDPSSWAAGRPQRYRVQMIDQFSNRLNYGGSQVALNFVNYPTVCDASVDSDVTSSFLSTAATYDPTLVEPGFGPLTDSVVDTGDGGFNFTILTTVAGKFVMNITINAKPYLPCYVAPPQGVDSIARFTFSVTPGVFDAATSRVYALTPSGRAGSTFMIRIAASDRYSNPILVNPPSPKIALAPYRGVCAPDARHWLSDTSPSTSTTVRNISAPVFTTRLGLASYIDVSFVPLVALDIMYINVTFNGTQIGTRVTPNLAYINESGLNTPLLGGVCSTLAVTSADTAVIQKDPEAAIVAAIPTSYLARGFDQYGNLVVRADHIFSARFDSRNISGYSFTVTSAPVSPGVSADQLVAYTPLWAGEYSVEVSVTDPVSTRRLLTYTTYVSASTCGGQTNGLLPYRCPEGGGFCILDYTNTVCASLITPAIPNACPAGTVACPDGGYCAASLAYCPPRQLDNCPTGYTFRCPSGDCRATAADCPSPFACPPGYSPCTDNRQCWKDDASVECALPPDASCTPVGNSTRYLCQDGDCVLSKEDCPTRKSCGTGQVICPDGSCAASLSLCYDQYLCYGVTPIRCPDGSCRSAVADCPKEITCPVGWVACENGYCSPSASLCQSQVKCTSQQTRCPDGSCRPNLALCPSVQSCPAAPGVDVSLVRCHDGACVPSIWQCATPVQCGGSHNFTCPDSSCVSDYKYCATGIRCPDASPVLCPDRSCVSQVSQCMQSGYCTQVSSGTPYLCPDGRCVALPMQCGASLACPSAKPVRCADGTCQAFADECSVGISACPDLSPVRCPDGSCATASDQCATLSQLTCPSQSYTGAPFQFVKCPSGHCAPTLGQCPTPLTCGPNLNRCRDGTCRTRCDTVAPNTCSQGQVTCPISVQGPSCAESLASCPATSTCPPERPIRCIDSSCAVAFADCPVAAAYSPNKVACPGSTWAPTLATCGTAVSCPKSLPAKCWDESCRLLPADCPPRPKCPAATPFACSDGSCYATLSDCRSAVRCNPSVSQAFRGTIKCPYYDNNLGANSAGCVATVNDCEKYNPLTVQYTKTQSSDSGLGSTQYRCPNLAKRCRDGSCRVDSTQCTDKPCPLHVPYRCPEGQCARVAAECRNTTNTCPFDTPAICADGTCAVSASACASYAATLVRGVNVCNNASLVTCPDGSCRASLGSCAQANGCTSNSEACADRNCVQRSVGSTVSQCVAPYAASTDLSNACPYNRPFQCPDGYCAMSSQFCPIYPVEDGVCSVTTNPANGQPVIKPFRCADGTCVFNLAQCAALAPCPDTSHRCPDGTCRSGRPGQSTVSDGSETCAPYKKTCPASRPFRCEESGLCAPSAIACIADSQEFAALFIGSTNPVVPSLNATAALATFTGCPRNRVRCASGRCALDSASCNTGLTRWETQAANGCPSGSNGATNGKCFGGSCDANCPLPNGCPSSTPYLCPDGQCTAGSCDLAFLQCRAGRVRCPSGHCETDLSQCTSKSQCPVSTPYRCASGECRRYPATINENVLVPNTAMQCKATVVCELPTPFLCADGSCAASSRACRPLMPCNVAQSNSPAFPYLCANLRCGNTAMNSTCTQFDNTCPPGNPVLCPNGACRRSVEECSWMSVNADKCTDPTNPVMCFDGFCRTTTLDCVQAQFIATHGVTPAFDNTAFVMNSTCNAGEVLCTSNGACLPGGSLCPPVPACPANMPRRCSNGACINGTLADCPTMADCQTFPGTPVADAAAGAMIRCEDGTCNKRGSCAVFDGCPLSNPYYCAGLANPCVGDVNECSNGLAANNNKPQACDFNCLRDQAVRGPLAYPVPTESDLFITLSVDAHSKPRSTLLVPAGAVHTSAGLVTVSPMPLSMFKGVQTYLDSNRAPEFGTDHFTSYTSLKSAPFTIKAYGAPNTDTMQAPYGTQLALTVTAWVDPLLYQVTTQQAAAAAAAAAVEVPCVYQASYNVERTQFTTNAAGQIVAIPCSGTSDVTKDSVTLTMDTCDSTVITGSVISSTDLQPVQGGSDISEACICYNLTRSTAPPAAYAPGYSIGQTVCTLYHRVVDAITSFTYISPTQAAQCPPQSAVTATTDDPTIRKLLYTATSVPPCQNTISGDAAKYIPVADICLARARKPPSPSAPEFASYGGSWDCVNSRDDRIANPVWTTGPTGLGATEFRAVIPASADAVNGEYAYAFVHSPLPPPPPADSESQSAWEQYGKIILIVVCCIGGFTIIAAYVTWRLIRYRRKYKENQKKKVELTERRNNLEEFSGGLGIADEEVDMVANPLVIELQNLEQQIKKVNDEMGVQEQRDAQTISRLEEDRKKLYAEIDRVKQAMAKAEAEAEAAAKITAARETAAAQSRANAMASANMSMAPGGSALEGGATGDDNFSSVAPGHNRGVSQVPVDAGSGTTATTTARGTTRLEFGQAKIRRPRDVSNT